MRAPVAVVATSLLLALPCDPLPAQETSRTASEHERQARLLLQQGSEDEALAELRAAAARGPLDRDLGLELARLELGDGRPDAAAAQLESVAERFGSVLALRRLAGLRASSGDHDGALAALRRALELAPNSEELLATYARLSLRAHDPLPAILTLEPLVRIAPADADYPYLLGVAHMQIGDMASAVEPLERAVELDPGRALPRIALGIALNQQKRYAEAERVLEEALRQAPEDHEALAALAEAHEGQGLLAEARRLAQQVLDRDPRHGTASLVLGMVLMKEGLHAEAIPLLERALAADASSAKVHYQLSLAYTRIGDREAADEHLELYRRAREELERDVAALRAQTGRGEGGMRR